MLIFFSLFFSPVIFCTRRNWRFLRWKCPAIAGRKRFEWSTTRSSRQSVTFYSRLWTTPRQRREGEKSGRRCLWGRFRDRFVVSLLFRFFVIPKAFLCLLGYKIYLFCLDIHRMQREAPKGQFVQGRVLVSHFCRALWLIDWSIWC